MVNFSKFEEKAGISFDNKELLTQAFVHRSYLNEHKGGNLAHNERLEFLGDAVLELVITDFLFKKYPNETEGNLTSYRAALVNAQTLSRVATHLGVNDFLLLSRGEAKDTGRARSIILADTMEAIIGAVYLDRGYDAAKSFIEKNILEFIKIDDIVENEGWLDAKSRFQEQAQEKVGLTPLYKTLKETGPDHSKYFTIGVFLGDKMIASGEGMSKQEAEQSAAVRALEVKKW
jgi:ribonuclease III